MSLDTLCDVKLSVSGTYSLDDVVRRIQMLPEWGDVARYDGAIDVTYEVVKPEVLTLPATT